jgi:hypothetical protein
MPRKNAYSKLLKSDHSKGYVFPGGTLAQIEENYAQKEAEEQLEAYRSLYTRYLANLDREFYWDLQPGKDGVWEPKPKVPRGPTVATATREQVRNALHKALIRK